jgi:hypothetical protein
LRLQSHRPPVSQFEREVRPSALTDLTSRYINLNYQFGSLTEKGRKKDAVRRSRWNNRSVFNRMSSAIKIFYSCRMTTGALENRSDG